MDAYIGTWDFVETENFDEYLKKVGVGMVMRKMASAVKPAIVFEKSGNGYKMTVQSTLKTLVTEFELDKEVEEVTGDGRKCKSVFHLVDGKLIQEQKGDKNSHFERWIEGDKLIITGECEGVKYRRVHKRA